MKSITRWIFVGSQVISSLVYAGSECTMHEEVEPGSGNYSLTFTDMSCLDNYVKQQTAAISKEVTDNYKAIDINAGDIKTKADKTSLVQGLTSSYHYTDLQVKEVKSEVDSNAKKIKENGDYTFRKGDDILKRSKQYTDQQVQEADQQVQEVKSKIDSNTKKIKENTDYTDRKGWDVYNKVMSVLSGEPNLLEIDYDASCQPSSYRPHDEPPYHVYIAALGNGGNAYNSGTAYFKVNTQYPSFITLSSWNGSGDAMAAGVGIAITYNGGEAIDVGSKLFITRESDVCDVNEQNCSHGDLAKVRRLEIANSDHQKHKSGTIYNNNHTGNARIVWPWPLDYNPFANNSDTYGQSPPYRFTKPYGYIQVHCGN